MWREKRDSGVQEQMMSVQKTRLSQEFPLLSWGSRFKSTMKAWTPIVARVGTLGLTLLGLAGIGLAARRSPSMERIAERTPSEVVQLVAGGGWLKPAPAPTPSEVVKPAALAEVAERPCTPVAVKRVVQPARTVEQRRSKSSPSAPLVVSINTASAREFRALPGIGKKRSTQIVALRDRMGGFSRLTDLLRVKGIGVKSLRKLLPHLVLGQRPVAMEAAN